MSQSTTSTPAADLLQLINGFMASRTVHIAAELGIADLLVDGRLLVAEYKGEPWAGVDDTNEKRAIGRLWEQRSAGNGLFIVVEHDIDGVA